MKILCIAAKTWCGQINKCKHLNFFKRHATLRKCHITEVWLALIKHIISHWRLLIRHHVYSCCSATKSCLMLCDPINGSTPGFPVLHYLPELTQTHIHWVDDALQPCHPLSIPSPHALNLPSIRWPEYWSFSFSIRPFNEYVYSATLETNKYTKKPNIWRSLNSFTEETWELSNTRKYDKAIKYLAQINYNGQRGWWLIRGWNNPERVLREGRTWCRSYNNGF